MAAGGECGEEVGEVFGGEFVGWAGGAGWESLQGVVGLEGDADTGKDVEAMEEVGVERKTEAGEGTELGWVMRVGCGEHSRGGGGGLREGSGAVEYGDADATVVEFEGERETDDACASDADVEIRRCRVVHRISLVGWKKLSPGSIRFRW